jgi:hypothetical protein
MPAINQQPRSSFSRKPALADKSSRLGKALEFVDQKTEKVRELARTYNKLAANIGLSAVLPLLLEEAKD